MPAKPFKYQRDGVRDMEDFLTMHGGVLLGDDMGLGKTLQTLWLLCRSKPGPMLPALIVCPANVKYGWEHTALEHVNLRAQVLEGRTPPEKGFGTKLAPLTIINPDILPAWLPYLKRAKFQTLVMDECHQFGNHKSKRTLAMWDLAEGIPFRVALSGTPLMNSPCELWPTLYALRPDMFNSLFSFAEEFGRPKLRFGKWQFKGSRNLDKLHPLLRRNVMVRRMKEEVLDDLPAKTRMVVPMDLTDRAEYDRATNDFKGWLKANYRDKAGVVQRAAKATAVVKVGYLVRLAAKLKARAVVDWVNRFLEEYPNEKIVLFTVHRNMVGVLERRVKCKGVTVDGSVTGRARREAVNIFRNDPTCRKFIGNMKAAGVGVDGLQDVCNNAAFTELWWVPGVHTQAEDRIHRIGQDSKAWIHYLVAGGTIEEKLCSIIQEKQKVIHATLDGADYQVDMDVYDQLIKSMETQK